MAQRTEEDHEIVYKRRVGRLRRKFRRRAIVNIFIVWHVFALIVWNVPRNFALSMLGMPVVGPYMTSTGLMQGWAMFAPEPYRLDVSVEAQITYAGGEMRSWYFPRMAKLGYADRYGKERWRKYVEIMHQDQYRMLWPAAVRYAAQQNNIRPSDPPVHVELVRHWRFIPAPGETVPPMQSLSIYSADVHPEDLR